MDLPPVAPAESPPEPLKKAAEPTAKHPVPRPDTGFGAMPLSDAMFAALDQAGYLEPTPVQAGLIPRAMKGDDLMGQARTGTGKNRRLRHPHPRRARTRHETARTPGPRPRPHPGTRRPGPRRVCQAGRGPESPNRGRLRR